MHYATNLKSFEFTPTLTKYFHPHTSQILAVVLKYSWTRKPNPPRAITLKILFMTHGPVYVCIQPKYSFKKLNKM